MNNSQELEPAGAGLPFLKLLVARIYFDFYRWLRSDTQALEHVLSEAKKIESLWPKFSIDQARHVTLVPPLFGIEDSSRNWSPAMVLEHVAIVNEGILGILKSLNEGREMPEVKIQDVKPSNNDPEADLARFKQSVENYRENCLPLLALSRSNKLEHPWFGALDSHGWHCLVAVHHTIHLRQLQEIGRQLGV